MNIKKFLVGGAAGALMLGVLIVPAFASPTDYDSNPRRQQAIEVGAQCGSGAGSGAFEFYSHGYIPEIYETPRAADGTQTGLNNSAVCGNRQGNL